MADSSDSESGYSEIFDADQFVRDGNDIRFQLPSQNINLTLTRDLEDIQRRTSTIKRRKTKSLMRRKSTKPPTAGKYYHFHCLIADLMIICYAHIEQLTNLMLQIDQQWHGVSHTMANLMQLTLLAVSTSHCSAQKTSSQRSNLSGQSVSLFPMSPRLLVTSQKYCNYLI